MKSILTGYRTPWLVEFWAQYWCSGIFVHLLNHLAIVNHASVTHLTSQTTHMLPLSQPPPQLPGSPCHHHNPSPTACNNYGRPQHGRQQHVNATSAHEQVPTRWMQQCSMSLTATEQREWWMRNACHFHYSLVSAPIILLWFLTWIPSATSPDDKRGWPPPTSTLMTAHHPPPRSGDDRDDPSPTTANHTMNKDRCGCSTMTSNDTTKEGGVTLPYVLMK